MTVAGIFHIAHQPRRRPAFQQPHLLYPRWSQCELLQTAQAVNIVSIVENHLGARNLEFVAFARMVSTRIARCSSPRPETRNVSADSVSSTRRETFVRSSSNRRSRNLRECSICLRGPKRDVFTPKVMRTVVLPRGWLAAQPDSADRRGSHRWRFPPNRPGPQSPGSGLLDFDLAQPFRTYK